MKSKHTVCYISNASPTLTDKDIDFVLEDAAARNSASHITGILLYNLGHFFQVIEGEESQITELFENKIMVDPRHSDIYVVYNKSTTKPVFFDYSSKFNIVKTEKDLANIKEYLLHVRTSTSDKLTRLLRPFVLYETLK